MRAGYLLLKFLRYISIALFVVLLFIAYYYLPDNVGIHYNEWGKADAFMDKSTFFYTGGVLIVFFNIAIALLARLIISVPVSAFPMPNSKYWQADKENRHEFYEILQDWLNSLIVIVNFLFILCLYALLRIHTSIQFTVSDYWWLLPIALGAIGIWLFFLPTRLLIKKNALLD